MGEAGLGALNQEITLELCHRIDDVHGHFSSRAGEIDATKCEAMDTKGSVADRGGILR